MLGSRFLSRQFDTMSHSFKLNYIPQINEKKISKLIKMHSSGIHGVLGDMEEKKGQGYLTSMALQYSHVTKKTNIFQINDMRLYIFKY